LEQETELVGDSPEINQLKQNIFRVAPTDAMVLIRGESGVGKELVARAMHFASNRQKGLFVCMNCAALSESLLESELFGHEKGSFTGATGRKIGKFEQADKGTLFLDEVGEMSLAIQAKFLRVLEGHPFERVGGSTPIKVDVRVVAATNRDLEQAVEEGKFRKDLYFRLHVVEIAVPPLREHKTDIPRLVRYFVERFAKKSGQVIRGISDKAMEMLSAYDWPGNIRELQNAVERAVVLCSSDIIQVSDIHLSTLGSSDPASVPGVASPGGYREAPLDVIEQEHILTTLQLTNGNKTRAAQILGIERSTLDRKLKRYEQHHRTS
ncbi:MAG: sigma-54 dependent transcriptional regulator, partial [Planctomycetaceae bacterium]